MWLTLASIVLASAIGIRMFSPYGSQDGSRGSSPKAGT